MSIWPPLWSSGQSFWLQIQRSRVRFPALPHFLSSSGSGTRSTQPREVNWGATWIKKSSGSGPEKQRLTAVGIRCADHVTPLYLQKLALTSPTSGGRSVGIVRSRTKATEFFFYILDMFSYDTNRLFKKPPFSFLTTRHTKLSRRQNHRTTEPFVCPLLLKSFSCRIDCNLRS